jgi:hypothetical protein
MQEKIPLEKIEKANSWQKILDEVSLANRNFTEDYTNEEKLEKFKKTWDKAFEQSDSTEEEEELNRYCPIDNVGNIHSERKEKLLAKWGKLDEEEEDGAGTDLFKLKHAYDHAPNDEHKKIALSSFVSSIAEKDARRIHQEAGAGTDLAMALENKFGKLFERRKAKRVLDEEESDGGLEDMEDTDDEMLTMEEDDDREEPDERVPYLEEPEKHPALLHRIRKTLGLE